MAKNQTEEISKSKAKRIQRHKEVAKQKKAQLIGKIAGIVLIIAIILCIGSAIGWNIYKAVATTDSSSEFSKYLTDEGMIQNADVSSAVTVADYANDVIPLSEVQATEEEMQTEIDSALNANKILSTDATLAIADGDTVNIDYVGTIDNVAFEGGSSDGAGYDLTIGSGSFVDDFEDQLVGHKPGENVTVEVTFPDDYQGAEVAGKDASFAVTVNGIYVTPELTDAFVAENLSDYASTVDEYHAYLENKYYEQHLTDYLETYLADNSTVNTYPTDYVKNLMQTLKYQDELSMEYYNQMYQQYTGSAMYETIYQMKDQNWLAYEKELKENARQAAKEAMVYQAIYEKEGLSFDLDAYIAELDAANGEGYFENATAETGQGYLIQQHIKEVVLDYLIETVNVQ